MVSERCRAAVLSARVPAVVLVLSLSSFVVCSLWVVVGGCGGGADIGTVFSTQVKHVSRSAAECAAFLHSFLPSFLHSFIHSLPFQFSSRCLQIVSMNGQVSGQKPLIHHSFHAFVHSFIQLHSTFNL